MSLRERFIEGYPHLRDANGHATKYGLFCGERQRKEINGVLKELFRSGAIYVVELRDNKGRLIQYHDFALLEEARKKWDELE